MLKLPPGLAQVAEQQEGGRMARSMKAKEIQRDEKWRAMAKMVKTSTGTGGGMLFEFDTKDPKLVTRTWKGIPDRWRATAWYSFLAESAKKKQDSPSEDDLIESFYELQGESSAEDVQIDVDVPRTINSHIMFRRRYRGGYATVRIHEKTKANRLQPTTAVPRTARHVVVSTRDRLRPRHGSSCCNVALLL